MADSLALVKKDTVDVVAAKIREFQEKGEIHFPANYSPEDAMKSAWLTLQTVVDRNSKPALMVCTRDSIANALLDMVVQGLNPAKKQGYFIVYGQQLVFQRSYFGTIAVTKRVTGAKDVFAQVVYQGDKFAYEIKRGRKVITEHIQTLESVNAGVIVGAYCTLILADDTEFTDFMTLTEIHQAWKQSKQNPLGENSTHSKFPGEMAKRTVINRACKIYMNASDDSSLVMKHFRRSDDATDEAEVAEEIAQHANTQTIDAQYTVQEEPVAENEPEPVAMGGAPF